MSAKHTTLSACNWVPGPLDCHTNPNASSSTMVSNSAILCPNPSTNCHTTPNSTHISNHKIYCPDSSVCYSVKISALFWNFFRVQISKSNCCCSAIQFTGFENSQNVPIQSHFDRQGEFMLCSLLILNSLSVSRPMDLPQFIASSALSSSTKITSFGPSFFLSPKVTYQSFYL